MFGLPKTIDILKTSLAKAQAFPSSPSSGEYLSCSSVPTKMGNENKMLALSSPLDEERLELLVTLKMDGTLAELNLPVLLLPTPW